MTWGQQTKGSGKAAPSLKQEVEELKQLVLQSYADPWTRKGIGKGAAASNEQPKGKGKGMGKDKGKSKGQGKSTKFWPCPEKLCMEELNDGEVFWNHPGRKECKLCSAWRS